MNTSFFKVAGTALVWNYRCRFICQQVVMFTLWFQLNLVRGLFCCLWSLRLWFGSRLVVLLGLKILAVLALLL